MRHYFVGVDGGGTKCTVRVEDENGNLLGRETSGPANVRLSVEQAWRSIHAAFNHILLAHGINLTDKNNVFHAGMGLAGCEIATAYETFLKQSHPFTTLAVCSDAYTACLGAHGGKDGAIIIAGTGVVGFQLEAKQIAKVSGHGFPLDDEGGGAWMGLQAIRATLHWCDGRLVQSPLLVEIYARFDNQLSQIISWSQQTITRKSITNLQHGGRADRGSSTTADFAHHAS